MLAATTLVVPCYNEAARLRPDRFLSFVDRVPGVRLLFVNDGSTDATAAVLDALRERLPDRIAVLGLERNAGKAEAVRRGVLRALDDGAGFVGYWDADLATPLEAAIAFLRVLRRRPAVEMVMGSRVQLLGRMIERSPMRHYLGRVFATAASLVLRLPAYDTQCGAKLFRTTRRVRAAFERPFRSGWIFDVEIIARLVTAPTGATRPPPDSIVWEYPLLEWRDVAGSKLKARDFGRAGLELARIWWDTRRGMRR